MNPILNASRTTRRNIKLLIIEDDDDQWNIIQTALGQGQVTTERAAGVDQAIALLQAWGRNEWEMPKLILLDLYLPRKGDGWQLLRQLKAMPNSVRRIPIVMLTSSGSTVDIQTSYDLGIAAYLIKPSDFAGWVTCLGDLRTYWLETTTLLPLHYDC